LGIILKKIGRKKTFLAKDRIQGCDTMALAQDKSVSFRISSFIRTYIQEAPVKGDE
jgi:cold shock CspA family protein